MSEQQTTQTSEGEGATENTAADAGVVTETQANGAAQEQKATDANGSATEAKPSEGEQKTEEAKPAEFVYADWAKGLQDEKQRDYAQRFKSVEDVLTGAMKLREEISSRIKLPGKDAKPEEIAAFKKQIGAPETPDGYEIKAPEGYSLDGPVGMVTDMAKDLAHKHHIPASAYQEFSEGLIKMDQEIQEKVTADVQQWRADKEKEIRKEFGGDFEASLNAGKRARDTFGGEELTEFFNTPVTINGVSMTPGDHPAMIRFMATLGKRMGEDGVIGLTTESEKASVKEQIAQMEKENPVGSPGWRSKDYQQKREALYAKLYGDDNIVGSSSRNV